MASLRVIQKSKNGSRKNSIYFWEMFSLPKSPKMDHKKIVYTFGNWLFTPPKKMCFVTPKSKNGSQQNSIHFWEISFFHQKSKNGAQKIVYTSGQHFQNICYTYLFIFPSYPIIAYHSVIAFFIFFVKKCLKLCYKTTLFNGAKRPFVVGLHKGVKRSRRLA